jgi:hypothetical protein
MFSTIYARDLEAVNLPTTSLPAKYKPTKKHPEGFYCLETSEPAKIVEYMEGLDKTEKAVFLELLMDMVREDAIPYDDGSGDKYGDE